MPRKMHSVGLAHKGSEGTGLFQELGWSYSYDTIAKNLVSACPYPENLTEVDIPIMMKYNLKL